MTIRETLGRAFEIVKREPALWVLGTLVAFLGGGLNFQFQSSSNYSVGEGDINLPPGTPPVNVDPTLIITIIIATFLILLAIGLILFLLRCVLEAGLINGTARAASGEDVHWGQLVRVGWSRYGRRLAGVKILLALPGMILGLVAIAFLVGPLIALIGATATIESTMATAGVLPGIALVLFCAVPLFLLLIPLSLLLHVLDALASRAVVLADQGVTDAIRMAWRTIMAQKGVSFRYFLVDLLVTAVGSLVLSLAGGLFIVLLGVPIFLMAQGATTPIPLLALLGFLAIMVVGLILAVLQGPVVAYLATFWTLAWQELRRVERGAPAPAAEVAAPGLAMP